MSHKKLLLFLLPLIALLAGSLRLAAQCTSQAGTLVPGTYQVCPNTPFTAPYNNDAVLDADDGLFFVLHDGTPTSLGNIFYVSTTPLMQPAFWGSVSTQTYQLACIVSNNPWGTWPDFNDPCLSMSGGATLTFRPSPSVFISYPDLLNCNGNSSVTLQANPGPLGIAYQYQWSAGVSNANIANPTVSTSGTYTVAVSNGQCSNTATVTVHTPEDFPMTISHSNFTCNEPAQQTLYVRSNYNGPASGGDLTYQWSNNSTSNSITIPTEGTETYCVTATFAQGCSKVLCDTAIDFVPSAEIIYNQLGCTDSLNFLYVNSNFGNAGTPSFIYWSDGTTGWSIQDPGPGQYSVTISNTNGCAASANYVVENTTDQCITLEGTVYRDMNSSCTADDGEVGAAHHIIRITNSSGAIVQYAYSDESGHWGARLEAGTYTLHIFPAGDIWTACVHTYTVTVAEGATYTQDFFLQPSALCSDLEVELTNSWMRRCLPASHSIQYCNNGSITAEDAYIELVFDPMIIVDSATVDYTPVPGAVNVFRVEVGDVEPGACEYFHFATRVHCDAALGEAICVKATAFPHAPCGPQSNWSGASLALSGTCDGDSLTFVLKNVGTAPMSQELEYVVIEDAIMMLVAPPPSITLNAGNTHTVRVPANGSTWRIQAEQEPNHPGNSNPSLTLEGCTTGQTFSTGYVNQYPLDDADPWLDEDCTAVTGSYDPNDKQGYPLGYGSQHQINRGDELEYVIRFQNIGNDTAFTVVIRDTLSAWLDATGIRPGASSHPYKFDFYGEGSNIKFTFDHINLPDSSTNEAGSQGFVSYRVRQRTGVPFGSNVFNSASIYFDYNAPVVTNTTRHLIDTNFVSIVLTDWTPATPDVALQFTPNPAREAATVSLQGLPVNAEVTVEIIDQLGRLRRSIRTSHQTLLLERGQLPAGIYTVRITGDQAIIGAGKIVFSGN